MIVLALAIFVGAVLMSEEMDTNMKFILIITAAVLYYLLGAIVPVIAALVGVGIIAKERLA